MRLFFFLFMILSSALYAQVDFQLLGNDREGSSFYSRSFESRGVKKLLKSSSKDNLLDIFNSVLKLQDQKKLCSFSLNQDLLKGLRSQSLKLDLKSFIYILRQENKIDDVVVKILLDSFSIQSTQVFEKNEEELIFISENEKNKSLLQLISAFDSRFRKGSCFDEAYRNYYQELLKVDKKLEPLMLESLNYFAFKKNRITESTFLLLEQARINNLEMTSLTLSSYVQRVKTLRAQYPLRDQTEKSDFVTKKQKKMDVSYRQKLFENYSEIQIILMGNVIKKLRSRLEYDAVEISGYRDGVLQERIPLEPMERFRFAIKALRKEMSMLATNSFFNGRAPDYLDLMVASYEIGIIPSSELDTVASLEEMWNPHKTLWDKAGIWVKAFASVATIVIPPPYGFIPALVIVVIEASAKKSKDPNTNDPTSMF